MLPPPPRSTLFPYTTLFRSVVLPLGLFSSGHTQQLPQALANLGSALRHVNAGVEFRNGAPQLDRKSTRLNSSHPSISYAVFCLKKKTRCVPLSLRPPYRSPC